MRTERKNPAYKRFRKLLPESGLYPAKWVDIFTNTNDDMEYEEVEVVFIPRGEGAPKLDRSFWDEYAAYNRRWMGDLGNSVSGWMMPGGLNPEKVFGGMLYYGFASREALDMAISEFAHIEECEWARAMKKGSFADVLLLGSENRDAIERALTTKANQENRQWALDMLEIFKEEAEM